MHLPPGRYQVLRHRNVAQQLDLSISSVHARYTPGSDGYDPDFPKPIKLGRGTGPTASGFISLEIAAYVQRRIDERDEVAKEGERRTKSPKAR